MISCTDTFLPSLESVFFDLRLLGVLLRILSLWFQFAMIMEIKHSCTQQQFENLLLKYIFKSYNLISTYVTFLITMTKCLTKRVYGSLWEEKSILFTVKGKTTGKTCWLEHSHYIGHQEAGSRQGVGPGYYIQCPLPVTYFSPQDSSERSDNLPEESYQLRPKYSNV